MIVNNNMIGVPEELVEFIRAEIKNMNYELVNISTRAGRGFFLEVVIDKEGGITLDECGDFNKKVSLWIDGKELFRNGYTLDVCSPGLDRVLKSDMEFLWAVGRTVEVRMREPVDSRNVIVGKLLKVDDKDGLFIEETGGETVCVDRNNTAKVKLQVEIN